MKLILCSLVILSLNLNLSAQKPLTGRDSSIRGPQSFAMMIGISKYRFIRPLNYADKDADLFADFLRSPAGGSLKESNLFELTNEAATAGNFWSKGFQWLKAKDLKKGDRLFIYLAGHGDAIDADQFFFLGYDCNPGSDKDNYLISGAIQLYNLKKKIADQTSKGVEVYFIMDACRSNELPGGSAGQNFLNTAVSQKKAGEIMMLAAEAGQESLEDASIGNGHGLFTYYLVDGLSGLADTNGDNKISFSEIKTYVDKNVPPIAQQRFKRQQVPFFCCDEFSNKVVSSVDANYLKEWLRIKKTSGGNSAEGFIPFKRKIAADTALLGLYNRFNKAIKSGSLEGNGSAESIYEQLNKKYPNDPYTLDAQSTLAAEFINDGLKNIGQYIGCAPMDTKGKANWLAAGKRMEKAIALVRNYDPEMAASLRTRALLLLSLGSEDNKTAFQYAYESKAIESEPAYINNVLARLHMANKNKDSALYYADKAAKRAPNWNCALSTLSLAREMEEVVVVKPEYKKNGKPKLPRPVLGFNFGAGVTNSNPDFNPSGNTTLLGASSSSSVLANMGVIYYVPLADAIAIRPSLGFAFGNTNVSFEERGATGGVSTRKLAIKSSSLELGLPLIFKFRSKKAVPYFTLGPSLALNLDAKSSTLLPVKSTTFNADAGFGIEIKTSDGMVISPEIKYVAGLSDMKETGANTNYSNALGSLKRNQFRLGVYLRKAK